MIRTLIMLGFWALLLPFAALIGLPWTILTGNINLLYRMSMWGAFTGVRLTGVKVQVQGLEKLDPGRAYIFMSNHVSNLDPPIMAPLIPNRTSIMVKKELFKVPILGPVMRIGSLVPVDRGNREAGIAAVRAAADVIDKKLNMLIYVEGHRSFDGKLLPFKKGPFYLAVESGVPVVPITISGTHHIMPKGRFAIRQGVAKVIFHDPISPAEFGDRDCLMERVRKVIDSGLEPKYQESVSAEPSRP